MKPILEHLPLDAAESFVVKYFDYNYYPTPWHFHPEYELVLVTESTGKRFIGDRISDFKPGDLVLLGPFLPHLYRNDAEYYELNSSLRAKSIVIHFLEGTFGDNFFGLPETEKLQALFNKSRRGLDIIGETNKRVSRKLPELLKLSGLERWLKLLEILNHIAESAEYRFISSHEVNGQSELESDRLNKVMEFVINYFPEDIYIADVANLVNMTESSFSRYFRQRTRKTFASFVTEIRLNKACKLLIENTMNISEICFKCGFNNLSNFNRQFNKVYGVNPLTYRRQYWNKM
ncbi:AraC family transcriptional regulator [Daejeonella sp.]|jgi:AraC-like DNA-binding protein|uniref:AraC family transcriptional regulator n=1 Tax=Daejeonella sp. TaxID=2805397 RepID=UPI0037BFE7CE